MAIQDSIVPDNCPAEQYLTIIDWQQDRDNMDTIKRPWISLPSNFNTQPQIVGLTFNERAVYIGCIMLIAEHGSNIVNDPLVISRQLGATPKQTHLVPGIIAKLIQLGLVSLTGQRLPSLRIEKNRKETSKTSLQPSAHGHSNNQEEETIISEEELHASSDNQLEDVSSEDVKSISPAPFVEEFTFEFES